MSARSDLLFQLCGSRLLELSLVRGFESRNVRFVEGHKVFERRTKISQFHAGFVFVFMGASVCARPSSDDRIARYKGNHVGRWNIAPATSRT
jgi:hypothetical protein